jgi:hypothetical protein
MKSGIFKFNFLYCIAQSLAPLAVRVGGLPIESPTFGEMYVGGRVARLQVRKEVVLP